MKYVHVNQHRALLIEVACPLCGSLDGELFSEARSHLADRNPFSITRCTICGFMFLSPRPDEMTLDRLYDELSTSAPTVDYAGRQSPRWWIGLQGADVVGSTIDAGPVLDVGCGSGDQMARLAQLGFDIDGIDRDPAAIARVISKGLKAKVADIKDVQLEERRYAWIVMSHVLEHLPDPVASLADLRSALRSGGRILILVPDASSPVRRLFRQWWHGWDPPFHLNHFTKPTLATMLERGGFVVERIQSRGNVEDVTRSLDLWRSTSKRRLLTRALLIPFAWLGTILGKGSFLVAIARRD